MVALVARLDEAVTAHPAPRGNVVRSRRVGREDGDGLHIALVLHDTGEADDREGTALAAGVHHGVVRRGRSGVRPTDGPRSLTPSGSRTARIVGANAAVSAATSSDRAGETAGSGSVTRTLPWVSTPIAASTWLGSRVLEVQAEPLATANPASSKAPTRASPST